MSDQASARAVATAVAEAGASTKVILIGDCSEDAAGLATAKAEANATAVAVAVVQAIAEARANSTDALDIKEVEQVEVRSFFVLGLIWFFGVSGMHGVSI